MNFQVLLFLLSVQLTLITTRQLIVVDGSHETWYTKYDVYPPYCSIPDEMKKRKIPNIQSPVPGLGETHLLHVTAILRHGARTPYKPNLNCWENFTSDIELVHPWNCNLTTFLAPPPPERIHQEEGENNDNNNTTPGDDDSAMFLFEKLYDAYKTPEQRKNPSDAVPIIPSDEPKNLLRNYLSGTCQLSQLLLQGYEQELTNGKNLREAYIYDSTNPNTNTNHDKRLQLLDISKNGINNQYIWDSLNYRVDDDQRTLMSGQVVLRGMFGPELNKYVEAKKKYPVIPLHTNDRDYDVLEPGPDICERLYELNDEAYLSTDYQQHINSSEIKLLKQFQVDVLKTPYPEKDMNAIDCLMTTICTDRTLPESVNDYKGAITNITNINNDENMNGDENNNNNNNSNTNDELDKKYGPNRFQRLIDYSTYTEGYAYRYNNGAFAKLGMGPMWAEIMEYINPFLNNMNHEEEYERSLSVFAGHDTTIMPLLVSLGPDVWDGVWAPYASMMIIEIHAINMDGLSDKTIYKSNYAFRLLYNGNVLTNKVPNCHPDMELCDAQILVDQVKDFAKRNVNCTRENPVVKTQEGVLLPQEIVELIGITLVILIAGWCFGLLTMYMYMVGYSCCCCCIYGGKQKVNTFEEGFSLTTNGNHPPSYTDDTDLSNPIDKPTSNPIV